MSGYRQSQQGIVSLIAVVVLLSVVAVLAMLSLQITGSGISDTRQQGRSVQALMLAESGLENSIRRLQLGSVTCDGTMAIASPGQAFGSGSYVIAAGLTTDFDGVTALSGTQCRIRSTGIAGNVSRTAEAVVETAGGGGGTIAFDLSYSGSTNSGSSISWNNNNIDNTGIGNTILIVGVSVRGDNDVIDVTYRGTSLTPLCNASGPTGGARTEVFFLLGAANGAGADGIDVTLSGNTAAVGGSISLTGVKQVTPTCNTNNGNSGNPSISINTTAANSYVVDVVSMNLGLSYTPLSGQTEVWDSRAGSGNWSSSSRVRGGGGYRAIAAAGAVTDNWSPPSFFGRDWSAAIVAVEPAPGTGAGVLRWREIARP